MNFDKFVSLKYIQSYSFNGKQVYYIFNSKNVARNLDSSKVCGHSLSDSSKQFCSFECMIKNIRSIIKVEQIRCIERAKSIRTLEVLKKMKALKTMEVLKELKTLGIMEVLKELKTLEILEVLKELKALETWEILKLKTTTVTKATKFKKHRF